MCDQYSHGKRAELLDSTSRDTSDYSEDRVVPKEFQAVRRSGSTETLGYSYFHGEGDRCLYDCIYLGNDSG